MAIPRTPTALIDVIAEHGTTTHDPALETLKDELLSRYGNHLQAILFYGSCLRGGNPFDGLVDLYVIVDHYRTTYPKRSLAVLNALLPPNVYYLEKKLTEGTLRAKYAVLSLQDLGRGTSLHWFHSYLWARFAQPTGLLYARDNAITHQIHTNLAQAVMTFTGRVLPRLPSEFTVSDVWEKGLSLTYRAELRAEKGQRGVEIYQHFEAYFNSITTIALETFPEVCDDRTSGGAFRRISSGKIQDFISKTGWSIRIIQGKLLSVVRLLKAFFTFDGGLDYIIWKLERHSGITIKISPRLRRYPLIFIWGLMWRLYRLGVFR